MVAYTNRHQCVLCVPADRLERAVLRDLLEVVELVLPVVRDQPRLQRHAGQLRRRRNQHRIRAARCGGARKNRSVRCRGASQGRLGSPGQLLDAERVQDRWQTGQRVARGQSLLTRIVVGQHDAALLACRGTTCTSFIQCQTAKHRTYFLSNPPSVIWSRRELSYVHCAISRSPGIARTASGSRRNSW